MLKHGKKIFALGPFIVEGTLHEVHIESEEALGLLFRNDQDSADTGTFLVFYFYYVL